VPAEINRQWLLASRPRGTVAEEDFSYHEAPLPTIGDGQFLVRTLYVSVDPGLRGWLTRSPEYLSQALDLYLDALFVTRGQMRVPSEYRTPLPIGSVMCGQALGQVVESHHPEYAVGDFVSGLLGWQDYCASNGTTQVPVFRLRRVHPLPRYLGVLGNSGMTAYFGMLDIARPREGETVLVSGAAGATGSTAAQIARIQRCRVIGIAGGPEKRRWLTDELGLDAAIDYKSEDLDARLKELCPDGVNVYFDNVGGRTLEIMLDHMATWGRIALCGTIAGYDHGEAPAGPANLARLATRRIRMEGFLAADYGPRYREARRQLSAWLATGALKSCEHIHEGFENIPRAFLGLFSGANIGKAMVKLADPV
jgi:NADPH-dependent curcumin reductase CurA